MLELDDLPDLAVDLDGHPGLEVVGGNQLPVTVPFGL
jgi:hypothetical protein